MTVREIRLRASLKRIHEAQDAAEACRLALNPPSMIVGTGDALDEIDGDLEAVARKLAAAARSIEAALESLTQDAG